MAEDVAEWTSQTFLYIHGIENGDQLQKILGKEEAVPLGLGMAAVYTKKKLCSAEFLLNYTKLTNEEGPRVFVMA